YREILQSKFMLDTATKNSSGAISDLLKIISTNDSLFQINKTQLTNDLLIKYQTEKKETENKILEVENAKRSAIIKWQRVLNFVVIILSFVIILILFFYLRVRSKQQKRAIEEEKIAAELKALKSQLNPHFIQNIFQIISNQVKINPQEVSDFLQKTSEYFRGILNGADVNVQSLEDELIFTEKYLTFQQSLFSNKLTYQIDVANDVDTYGILVPAMLLQPFVENSIKYGLQLYQKPMHIELKFTVDESFLNITITDDGNFLVNETIINDKSFGNALAEKRMLLFYKKNQKKPQLTAQKKDNRSGFIVNIKLPL
ncbi:MAG: sensor histidine kinase, partial [Dolichospermum sp.]